MLEAIQDFFENAGGNTGRSGHRRSIASSRAVSLARERLADLLGAESPDELIFTKNATEALNLAIYGLAADGGADRDHVARAQLGDAAAARIWSRRGRCTLEIVRADGNTGEIDLDEWAARAPRARRRAWPSPCTPRTSPACCCRSRRLAAVAAEAACRWSSTPRRAPGHVPLALPELGAAAVAMPGHKGLLGPSGTGLLYLAPGVEVEPLIRGGTGSQSELEVQPDFAPDRYESGTLNAMGIVGLGAAAEYLREVGIDRVAGERLTALGRRFRDGLAGIDGIVVLRPGRPGRQRRHRLA